MELEINSSHKKAKMPSDMNRRLRRILAGTSLALVLGSGSVMPVSANDAKAPVTSESASVEDNKVVEIPECYLENVKWAFGEDKDTFTVRDLGSITDDMMLAVSSNDSLEWLNYCDNVESLSFIIQTPDKSAFSDIKKLDHLKDCALIAQFDVEDPTICEEDFKFLKECDQLETLCVSDFSLEPGFIESLTQLKKLSLFADPSSNNNLDYSKLTFLEELDFGSSGPYNIAITLNSDEYNILTENGVKVVTNEEENGIDQGIEKVKDINQRLDTIVDGLEVTKDSSDQEKLDAILIYTLGKLNYDQDVSNALASNTEHSDLTKSFYEDGYLYGALEKDSAICGNYTALVSALSDRLDLDTHFLVSSNHAWNLVEVEGQQYYVDSTWLDGQTYFQEQGTKEHKEVKYDEDGNAVSSMTTYETIYESVPAEEMLEEGKKDELDWYMEDPTNIEDIEKDDSHSATNIPSYITIKPIEENIVETAEDEKAQDISNSKFEVHIGPKTFVIAGGALIGVLSGIGVAVGVSKKRDRERRQRLHRQQTKNGTVSMNSDFEFDFDSFGSDSDSYQEIGRRHR